MQRLILRASSHSLSFLKPIGEKKAQYLPYVTKSGISVAANLRKAFREEPFLEGEDKKVLLSVNSPTVLIPIDEYMQMEDFDGKQLYNYSITGREHEEVVTTALPDLNAVVLYGVNKDLKLVVTDRFADVRIQNVIQPVWAHLYRRSQMTAQRNKLFAYFHDGVVDVFSFAQKRFKYSNQFKMSHAHDALYYILFVWKQMGFDNEEDELHEVGIMEHHDWLNEKLKQYLRRVYVINPVVDLNRAPVSLINNLEYDMMLS